MKSTHRSHPWSNFPWNCTGANDRSAENARFYHAHRLSPGSPGSTDAGIGRTPGGYKAQELMGETQIFQAFPNPEPVPPGPPAGPTRGTLTCWPEIGSEASDQRKRPNPARPTLLSMR
jgi:hypothetical protein